MQHKWERQLHDRIALNVKNIEDIIKSWLTLPDNEVIYDCLHAYHEATNLHEFTFQTCACCSRSDHSTMEHISLKNFDDVSDTLNLHLLQCKNPLLIPSFSSLPHSLQHLMLDTNGITMVANNLSNLILHICKDCHTQLPKNKMPHFALANNLFHGLLPQQFQDLTWVEEMTCAIYPCTAHVLQLLYQSSDPMQPCVFHGNTCAHDLNVVSTVSVLPRTPDHVNQMLLVVFIGPGKYENECLKNMFHIRERKVIKKKEMHQCLHRY